MKKILFVVLLLIVSCGKVPQINYYTIDYDITAPITNNSNGVLFVKNFSAEPVFHQDKMVYKTSRYELKFDSYRRWVTPPAELLTQKAVEHLRKSGLFEWVTKVPPRQQSFYMLEGQVVQFQELIYNNEHCAQITVMFQLSDNSGEVKWRREISKKVPVTGDKIDRILAAFSDASCNIFNDLSNELMTFKTLIAN